MGVGNGVVVPVEARVGGFAHLHLEALLGRERVLGQGEQMRLLLGEERAHAARAIFRTGPIGGRALTPGPGLSVQIVQIAEAARGEEGVACESNRALDSTLLISARHRHRAGLEAVVGSQLQQPGVEMDRIARALEHRAAKIVVEQDPGHGIEPGERLDMSVDEVAHRRAQIEAQEQMARVGQHHHEGHQRTHARAPRVSLPKWAQSTCPCSPGSVRSRRYASAAGRGRSRATRARK